MVKVRNILSLALLVVVLSSCDKQRVYDKYVEIGENGWDASTKIYFDFNVEDTISLHNVYVSVRNDDQYNYSNLFLFVDTEFPNGKKFRDTLELILADNMGQWLGEGIGDVWDNQVLYRKNVRFPVKGNYKITYEQAMRLKQLPMISDVGLRVEKQEL